MIEEASRMVMRCFLALLLVALLALAGAGQGEHSPSGQVADDSDVVAEADAVAPVTDREQALTTQFVASAGVSRAPPARRA
ncbi:hypothetical protein [Actinoplanes sp. HUAS TT8]|uniref:hypothetical protein n=1 Tax=Actinoplanes sp. HUAS TT8 TaxID=3447453 RepID=UPI003F520661